MSTKKHDFDANNNIVKKHQKSTPKAEIGVEKTKMLLVQFLLNRVNAGFFQSASVRLETLIIIKLSTVQQAFLKKNKI